MFHVKQRRMFVVLLRIRFGLLFHVKHTEAAVYIAKPLPRPRLAVIHLDTHGFVDANTKISCGYFVQNDVSRETKIKPRGGFYRARAVYYAFFDRKVRVA